jgi:hypothetical protein
MLEAPRASQRPEPRGAFGGFIGPRNLLAEVRNAAPFLWAQAAPGDSRPRPSEVPAGPLAYLDVLRAGETLEASAAPGPAARSDYFALCLAAHFASAASYVPTDVDTKIRGALWREAVGTGELPRMRALALAMHDWDPRPVSARVVAVPGAGLVSGHDGEWLSVLCGGLLAAQAEDDSAAVAQLEAAIDAELAREARAFDGLARDRSLPLDLLRLAAILTHNAGDVLQSLAGGGARGEALRARFGDLARAGFARYGGAFGRAGALYRELLAAEGHRNYPLRKPRALRRDVALWLPIAPFLDDWGATLAHDPGLDTAERAEIVSALVEGVRKLPGQLGYARALIGFSGAFPRGLDAPELAQHYSVSVRRELRQAELRRALAVPRASFEASVRKRARALLAAPPQELAAARR